MVTTVRQLFYSSGQKEQYNDYMEGAARRREAWKEMAAMTIRSTKEGERKQKGQVKPEKRREARKETAAMKIQYGQLE
jgi:hypothetical protein